MRADVVVDIGNTRLKWGLLDPEQSFLLSTESLDDDPAQWERRMDAWMMWPGYQIRPGPRQFVVASVNPGRTERLRTWVEARGDRFFHLHSAAQLPLAVAVEHPDRVGIDRLLSAVVACQFLTKGRGAVLIGAGTAVTVDWLDEDHVYRGGAIFPGLDLMAEALHAHTALLPRVSVEWPLPALPAGSTIPAMQVGMFLAVAGGIREAVRIYAERAKVPPQIFFGGGQAPLLARGMGLVEGEGPPPWGDWELWPTLALNGIVYSLEALS
jgi:type III pantothenate kinase